MNCLWTSLNEKRKNVIRVDDDVNCVKVSGGRSKPNWNRPWHSSRVGWWLGCRAEEMSETSTNILNVAKNSVVKHHLTTIEGTSDGLIKNSPRAQHTNHQITTFFPTRGGFVYAREISECASRTPIKLLIKFLIGLYRFPSITSRSCSQTKLQFISVCGANENFYKWSRQCNSFDR